MAIHGFLESTEGTHNVGRAPRRTLHLEAHGATASGEATDVVIHNISIDGLLLESPVVLEPGSSIAIDLPEAGTVSGERRVDQRRPVRLPLRRPATPRRPGCRRTAQPDRGPACHLPARPDAPDDLPTRIQRLRKERGLTLAQVAGQLGVSKPTVWAWERGRARPIEERVEALAHALGVTRGELDGDRRNLGRRGREMLARAREQIAAAFGTSAEKVRIMIEL